MQRPRRCAHSCRPTAKSARWPPGVNNMAEALQTHRSELEKRIHEATADLAAKKNMAERANQAKSRFFAAASHDLRQPLHALSLFVAALKARNHQTRSANPDRQHRSLHRHHGTAVQCAARYFAAGCRHHRSPSGAFLAAENAGRSRQAIPRAGGGKTAAAALSPVRCHALQRSTADRAHPGQPDCQRHPLHRRWRRAGGLPTPRPHGASQRDRHRPRHITRPAGKRVPGVCAIAQSGARPQQGAGAGTGHRVAPRAVCWGTGWNCVRVRSMARCSASTCHAAMPS